MSKFVIRPANVKDAKRLAYIHVTSWWETYRGLIPDDVLDALSLERKAKQWERMLEDAADIYHLTFAAEVDNLIVGFANYGKERENDPVYRGELFAIYILKEFHERGIGRALVQRAVSGLLEMNISSMLIWVLSTNPSQKFYERLGGEFLREKPIKIGSSVLQEKAYGWRNVRDLI